MSTVTTPTTTSAPSPKHLPNPNRFRITELPAEGIEYALSQIFGPGPYLTDWRKAGGLLEDYEVSLEFYPVLAAEPAYWVARINDPDMRSRQGDIEITGTIDAVGTTAREALGRVVLASIFGEHIWMPGDLPLSPATAPAGSPPREDLTLGTLRMIAAGNTDPEAMVELAREALKSKEAAA